jgi:hypothetical protein
MRSRSRTNGASSGSSNPMGGLSLWSWQDGGHIGGGAAFVVG